MAYRLIYWLRIVVQFTLMDFLGSWPLEEIDLRTPEGSKRYKELFGKAPRDDVDQDTIDQNLIVSSKNHKADMEYLLSSCNERNRRLIAGFLAITHGKGGIQKSADQTGLDTKTVRTGKNEIISQAPFTKERIRRKGAGRIQKEKVDSIYNQEIHTIIDHELAGNPMKRTTWVRKSLRRIKMLLQQRGTNASPSTIRNTFKKQSISLKKNKKFEAGQHHPDREAQFQNLTDIKRNYLRDKKPIISIDAKKKELIGNFKNDGRTWRKDAYHVLDHDFPSAAQGKLIPFGIYDLQRNYGHVYCGTSSETSDFAVDSIVKWWQDVGINEYLGHTELLILCDCGGANGYRRRLWKTELQTKLADQLGLIVRICHYPSGASKYNPIEHKLFSFISLNWAGEPLDSYEKAIAYINSTTTTKGLKVEAILVEKQYQIGQKVSDDEINALNIEYGEICPNWNYVISPRT